MSEPKPKYRVECYIGPKGEARYRFVPVKEEEPKFSQIPAVADGSGRAQHLTKIKKG